MSTTEVPQPQPHPHPPPLPPAGPKDRDLIFSSDPNDEAYHKANQLLTDFMALHQLVWKCTNSELPKEEPEVQSITERLFELFQSGKGRNLAGMKDVPTPFLVGPGRFLQKSDETHEYKEISDEQAKTLLQSRVFAILSQESIDTPALQELRREFSEFVTAYDMMMTTEVILKPTDVIVLEQNDTETDKAFGHQQGNKTMFALASQYVNAEVATASQRLEAALSVFLAKPPVDDVIHMGLEKPKPEGTEKPRFILCRTGENDRKEYSLVKPSDAAEVTLMFVFEVWMEKELTAKRDATAYNTAESADYPKPSMDEPIDCPTPSDVLFGRGGMTNSHIGNKRFRDVIALHRPDYIKAIKNDKPNVARRIVRAIRTSDPPGRFLKKCEDGKWRDVGDKVAAEKASQALREKSNAEKRQRASQRESMRSKDGSEVAVLTKKAKTGDMAMTSPLLTTGKLNYIGPSNVATTVVATTAAIDKKDGKEELRTEGLPPNAVDKDGNILVTDWDILAGRGGLTNHHRGNKRFRDIVALHRPDYIRAPKVQKPSVARVIVRAIRNGDPPGRFLRKDEKTGKWYDIGDKRAAEKTSQALREKGGDKNADPTATAAIAAAAVANAVAAGGDGKDASYLLPALPKLEINAVAGAPEPVKADDAAADGEVPNAAEGEQAAETPAAGGEEPATKRQELGEPVVV